MYSTNVIFVVIHSTPHTGTIRMSPGASGGMLFRSSISRSFFTLLPRFVRGARSVSELFPVRVLFPRRLFFRI